MSICRDTIVEWGQEKKNQNIDGNYEDDGMDTPELRQSTQY